MILTLSIYFRICNFRVIAYVLFFEHLRYFEFQRWNMHHIYSIRSEIGFESSRISVFEFRLETPTQKFMTQMHNFTGWDFFHPVWNFHWIQQNYRWQQILGWKITCNNQISGRKLNNQKLIHTVSFEYVEFDELVSFFPIKKSQDPQN